MKSFLSRDNHCWQFSEHLSKPSSGDIENLSTYILKKKQQNPVEFYYTYDSAIFFILLNNITYTWGKGIQSEWGLLISILKITPREAVPIYIPQQQHSTLPVSPHVHPFQHFLHHTAKSSFSFNNPLLIVRLSSTVPHHTHTHTHTHIIFHWEFV